MVTKKILQKNRRHKKVHARILDNSNRIRLAVYRSNKHIYAQIIDDKKNTTLAHASDVDKELKKLKGKSKIEIATQVGALIAKRAKENKVNEVAFDRGGFLYKGRVKALAESARENGLKI